MRVFVTLFLCFAAFVLGRSAYETREDRNKLIGNSIASIMMIVSLIYVWI